MFGDESEFDSEETARVRTLRSDGVASNIDHVAWRDKCLREATNQWEAQDWQGRGLTKMKIRALNILQLLCEC